MKRVTKEMTAKKILTTAQVILVKTEPNVMTESTATIACVLQVLTGPTVSTISTTVLTQTVKTTLPVLIRSMGFIASARKDSLGNPVRSTLMSVSPIRARTKPCAWIWLMATAVTAGMGLMDCTVKTTSMIALQALAQTTGRVTTV